VGMLLVIGEIGKVYVYKTSEDKFVIEGINNNLIMKEASVTSSNAKLQTKVIQNWDKVSLNILLQPKSLAQLIYFCQVFSFLFGLTAIIGICVIYLKRKVVTGSIYESHFIWQTKTLWIVVSAFVIGWCTSFFVFFVIGFFFIAIAIVWNIYRTIKGYLLLLEDKPIPNPTMLI
jgi:uncharacterized membrane protein